MVILFLRVLFSFLYDSLPLFLLLYLISHFPFLYFHCTFIVFFIRRNDGDEDNLMTNYT